MLMVINIVILQQGQQQQQQGQQQQQHPNFHQSTGSARDNNGCIWWCGTEVEAEAVDSLPISAFVFNACRVSKFIN